MGNVILSFGNVKNAVKLVVLVMGAEISNLKMVVVCHVGMYERRLFKEGHSMKNEDFKNYANKAKEKLQNAKDMAQDKMQDFGLDKKLDSLKEQTQKTMSATAEKVKEMELDKKLSNLNDNVEKYAKATAEKTKETVSSAAKTVKDMELDKKIENSEFEKRTGFFAKIKRYRAIIAIGIIVIVAIGAFVNLGNKSDVENTSEPDTNVTANKDTGKTEQGSSKDVILHADDWNNPSLTGQNKKAYDILMSSEDRVEIVNFRIMDMIVVLMAKDDNFSIRIEQGVGVTDDNLRFITIRGNCVIPKTGEKIYGSVTYKINIQEQTCEFWGNNEEIRQIWAAYKMGNLG